VNRLSCLLVLALAVPAPAHFVWIVPAPAKDKVTARVIFSDTLRPDSPDLLKKIAHAKLFVRNPSGEATAVKHTADKGALVVTVPPGPHAVLAICRYGVITRGGEPFLLNYYAKTFTGLDAKGARPGDFTHKTWDSFPLEVVPMRTKGGPAVRVLWHGKPLAGAEIVLLVPGKDEGVERTSDKEGLVKLEGGDKPGMYGVRARHVEKKEGKHEGKAYRSVRHYATLTWAVGEPKPPAPAGDKAPKPDAGATRLLAEARAARAQWRDFPGFTADVEVNVGGKVSKGTVAVGPKGKVSLKLEGEGKDWARRTLDSVVGHRLDNSAALKTPCAFADDGADHPLGRAVRVLNDEFHSSYHIRDRQIVVVNRRAGPVRFTITVLENTLNAERRYLPVSYVVNTWDLKTDALQSSAAHHQTWQRVGAFDLPRTVLVVTASAGKQEARSIKLSNHRLLGEEKR
jgi:hypothetical protein